MVQTKPETELFSRHSTKNKLIQLESGVPRTTPSIHLINDPSELLMAGCVTSITQRGPYATYIYSSIDSVHKICKARLHCFHIDLHVWVLYTSKYVML